MRKNKSVLKIAAKKVGRKPAFLFCIFLFEEEISEVCALVDYWFDERSLAGHQSGDARTMSRKDTVAVYYNADGDGTGDEVASITGICVLNRNDIAKTQLIQSILLADLFVMQGDVVVTVIGGWKRPVRNP